jgi:hypothetical protein
LGKDVEKSGRGLIYDMPAFAGRAGKKHNTSVRIPGFRAEILTQNLPNTKHE